MLYSNHRSFKYEYVPALAEDEPTFNYDDKIEFIDLLPNQDYQTLQNETQESSIFKDTFAKTWKIIGTSNYPDSGADTSKHQASSNSPDKIAGNSNINSDDTIQDICTPYLTPPCPPTRSSSFPIQECTKQNPNSIS